MPAYLSWGEIEQHCFYFEEAKAPQGLGHDRGQNNPSYQTGNERKHQRAVRAVQKTPAVQIRVITRRLRKCRQPHPPERRPPPIGFVKFPDYESAMFLAYLCVVPSMAAFTLTMRERFFENYARFFDNSQRYVAYSKINANQQAVIESVMDGGRNFVALQWPICLVGVLLAPQILEALGTSFSPTCDFPHWAARGILS